jgi:ABC-type multidrug transport system fused ATPase/permease subunit
MRDFARIYVYAGPYGKTMLAAVVLLTASVLFGVTPYLLIYYLILPLTAQQTVAVPYIAGMASAILLCLVLRSYLNGKGMSASHRLAYDTLMGMRKRMADKLRNMPLGPIQKYRHGNLKKLFVESIEEMEILLAHAIPEGISNLLTLFVVGATLFIVDWRMALLALAVVPIGILAFGLMFKDGLKRLGPYYQASEQMNNNIVEYIAGMEVIKVFNQTTSSYEKYRSSVTNYKDHALEWFRVSWKYMSVYSIVMPASLLFLLPAGIWFYVNETLTQGAFVLSILLAMGMGAPLVRLAEFLPIFPTLRQKAQKLEALFTETELPEGTVRTVPADFTVSYDNVSFAYDETEVLHRMSFTARAGSVTAIVGESGAGKSTLAKLLVRFWDVTNGAIRVGGVDIRDLTMEALMNTIGYVSQDVYLFNTTIMENIRMGKPDATDDEVIAMAKLAQCHDFIMATEQGYETLVGAAGDKLSGGQRQRISIARAMLKNAPIVVLDEATSATDPENEDRIQEALNGLIQGKTLIVIAHRLSTIKEADQILLLEHGQIAAQGTHEQLLQTSLGYQTMWHRHQDSIQAEPPFEKGDVSRA